MMTAIPYLAYLSLKNATDELYNAVVAGYYSQAVAICQNLSANDESNISEEVGRLLREGNLNLLNFCYKLWVNLRQMDIVIRNFPTHYKLIFNEDEVVIISKKFDLAIKLALAKDSDGDRGAWGHAEDKTNGNVAWQLLPVWENNNVMFYIKHHRTGMFLKSAVWPDNVNDRPVFGSTNNNTARHLWHLEPVVINNEHYFLIINRQFSQPLKLAESPDRIGDRRLWCHDGEIDSSDPTRFAWSIKNYSSMKGEL